MMNSKKSSLSSVWKYLFFLPLIGLSVLCLNAVKTIASETSILESIEQFEPQETVVEEPSPEDVFEEEIEAEDAEDIEDASDEMDEPDFEKRRRNNTIKRKISEELLFHCVLSGVDKSYLADLKREGFEVDNDNFRILAHIGPTVAELKKLNKDLKGMGYAKVELDDLLSLTIHEVDIAYIKELKAIGYPNLGLDEVVQASIHDISPEYFKELKGAGVDDLAFEELVSFAIHDVDADYIKKQQAKGKKGLSLEEYVHLKIRAHEHEHNDEH